MLVIALSFVALVTFFGVLITVNSAERQRQKQAMFLAPADYRKLEPREAVEERARLDSISRRLFGFTLLGDFIKVYPSDVVVISQPQSQRALVDEACTTTAVVRHNDAYDQIERICLTTAFSDGHWITTRKNFARDQNDLISPSEVDFLDFDWDMPLAELLATHAKRVEAALEHAEEGYRSAGSSNVILIRTMDEYLVDHQKRAELIRAKRKALASRS